MTQLTLHHSSLCMNYLELEAGDSIYIPADGIHAYLSGDIIECMARSNNVLNTGFCPRAERHNADLFVDTLTFAPHSAKECMLPSKSFDRSVHGKTKIYAPPMSEFNMLCTELKGDGSEVVKALAGPSMMIVTKGSGKLRAEAKDHELSEGYIFFIGAGVETEFTSNSELQVYRAYVE